MLRPSQIIVATLLTFSGVYLVRNLWSTPFLDALAIAVHVGAVLNLLFSDQNSRRDR